MQLVIIALPQRRWLHERASMLLYTCFALPLLLQTGFNTTILYPCYIIMTDILTYLLTYSMEQSPSEKLTGSAASQKIPRIFGTRRFLTVPTSARHLSISWANSIQSPQLPPTSWRSILILFSHLCLGLPNGLFSLRFPNHNPVHTSPLPHTCHIPRPSHSSRFYHQHNIG